MLFSALVIGILEDEPLGDVQQDYIYECASLNTAALDPFDAVQRHDVLTLQIGQVDIGKAGEAGEYKEVTDKRKALIANLLVHEPVELIILKIAAVNTLQVETDVGERVVGHQSVANAKEDDGLEGLERLGGSVGALADFRSQIKFEVMDDKRRDLGETEILATVLLKNHLSEALADKLILAVRGGAESAATYLLLDILIVGLEPMHGSTNSIARQVATVASRLRFDALPSHALRTSTWNASLHSFVRGLQGRSQALDALCNA